jgi:hypothetical protein
MKNKKLLYGLLGIGAIAGFYFYNKNKMPKTYSKKCQDDLDRRLMQEDVKPANFSKDFLERCAKNEQK